MDFFDYRGITFCVDSFSSGGKRSRYVKVARIVGIRSAPVEELYLPDVDTIFGMEALENH